MIICSGKSVLKGVAIGKIYFYKKQEYVLEKKTVTDTEAEVARFEAQRQRLPGSRQLRRLPSDSWMTYMKKRLQKQAKSRR